MSYEHADGGVESPVRMLGRSITVEGDILAESHQDLEYRMEELGTILTRPRWDWLTVDEEELGLSRQIKVWRPRRPMITRHGTTFATFTLQLEAAAFPRLAVTRSVVNLPVGQRATLANEGTTDADLTMTLVGPLRDVRLYWMGGAWAYTQEIPAGVKRVVEFSRHVVYDPANGKHSRLSAVGSWLKLPPGATTVSLGGTGAGRAEFTWRSSWA